MLDRFDELVDGLNHPEGVTWNPVDGLVYAGGEGGEFYSVTLDGALSQVGSSGGSMLGLAVDGQGRVYACDAGKGEIARLDPSSGVRTSRCNTVPGRFGNTSPSCAITRSATTSRCSSHVPSRKP